MQSQIKKELWVFFSLIIMLFQKSLDGFEQNLSLKNVIERLEDVKPSKLVIRKTQIWQQRCM